ncbi:MAG: metallophosphoesterase [Pseudomonadota bacterium]
MRVLQVSDVHFGVEDGFAIEALTRLVDDEKPDAILICGDLTQRGSKKEFLQAREWLDTLRCKKLVVPGNHDTPLLNLIERASAPFRRFEEYFGDLSEDLVLGDWRFIGLNTARGWQARQNWADGVVNIVDLKAKLDHPERLALICHHPLQAPPGSALQVDTKRANLADKLLKSSGVELILSGHIHMPSAEYRRDETGGYIAITSGTLSRRIRNAPASCNLLEFDRDQLAISSVSFTEPGPVYKEVGVFGPHLGTAARAER